MSNFSGLLPLALLAVFFVATVGADPVYDFGIDSIDFEPGHPVTFAITGPVNMSFNIRVANDAKDIVAGRDAELDASGAYTFEWTPSQEGQYNATVTYATGYTITKRFLIQQKVTSADIGELYRSLFGVETRLGGLIGGLDGKVNASLALGGVSILVSVGVLAWAKKNVSRADSEFERFLKSDVESVLKKLLDSKGSE